MPTWNNATPAHQTQLPQPRLVRAWCLVAATAAVALMACGGVTIVLTTVVHDRLLVPGTYNDTLTEQRVYRRIYSEILTDPAVRDATSELLGQLHLSAAQQRDVNAVSNAVLRLALPPEVLSELVDQLTAQVVAYVAGDEDELNVKLSVLGALERTDEATAVIVRRALSNASSLVLANSDEYAAALRSFVTALAEGRIPTVVPVTSGTDSTAPAAIETFDAALGALSPSVRDQVNTALRSGDQRDALITAGAAVLEHHLDEAGGELLVDGELQVDVLEVIGVAAPDARRLVEERLASLRGALRWVPAWLRPIGAAAVAVSAAGLMVMRRGRPAAGLGLAGGALLGCVAGTAAAWAVVQAQFRSPITAATRPGAVPVSIHRVAFDIDEAVQHSFREAVVRPLAVMALVGLALLVAAAIVALRHWSRQRPRRRTAMMAASVSSLGLATLAVLPFGRTADEPRACNGHVELCDRPYDEVVQAATHNSMSSPDVVRVWPEHDAGLRAQLDYGVRTLLLDTSYWRTIRSPEALGAFGVALPADVATALFDTLGSRLVGRPGVFLCHNECALGAMPISEALETIRNFLTENPDEVLTLIMQDAVTRSDTEAAFRQAGLTGELFDGDTVDGWPTFGELIDREQRLVVFSEQLGPPPAWYRQAFEEIQDTPYTVAAPAGFTCRLGRGPADANLFLLNHWVLREAPDRADANVVNSKEFIVERARRCAEQRGQLPNFIAVDFFSLGDVIGAVDELNNVG